MIDLVLPVWYGPVPYMSMNRSNFRHFNRQATQQGNPESGDIAVNIFSDAINILSIKTCWWWHNPFDGKQNLTHLTLHTICSTVFRTNYRKCLTLVSNIQLRASSYGVIVMPVICNYNFCSPQTVSQSLYQPCRLCAGHTKCRSDDVLRQPSSSFSGRLHLSVCCVWYHLIVWLVNGSRELFS